MIHKIKQLRIMNSDNRLYITSIKCVSAKNFNISLIIIIQRKHVLNK